VGDRQETLWFGIGFAISFVVISLTIPEDSLIAHLVLSALAAIPVGAILYAVFEGMKTWDENAKERDKAKTQADAMRRRLIGVQCFYLECSEQAIQLFGEDLATCGEHRQQAYRQYLLSFKDEDAESD
jgi:hypothetical protein